MKQFTFDGITITGDGMTVTARHYVNGELTCSAEAQPNPWDEYNFLSVAADALYKLKDKEQGSSTVEYCRADADNTAEYYKYRQEHPELFPDDAPIEDSSEEASENKVSEYPKIYQSAVDIADESKYIYYEGRPEVFWKDFKQGKFTIKVSQDDWSGLVASAKPYGVRWASGEALDMWGPYESEHKDDIYIDASSRGVVYSRDPKGFKKEICNAWDDIKDTFMTTDTSTNDAKDTPIPWNDIMNRNCIIRVRKQDWKKFAEQAAANNLIWTTGEAFSVEDVYPGYHLDLDAVYIGCAEIDHGLVWSTFHESFHIPEIIHFSRWCDND